MTVTCNKCGWVHFQVSRDYAENEVKNFNAYYASSPPKVQEMFAGPSSIDSYAECFRCANTYKDFRDAVESDCPDGCTQQPIIDRNE